MTRKVFTRKQFFVSSIGLALATIGTQVSYQPAIIVGLVTIIVMYLYVGITELKRMSDVDSVVSLSSISMPVAVIDASRKLDKDLNILREKVAHAVKANDLHQLKALREELEQRYLSASEVGLWTNYRNDLFSNSFIRGRHAELIGLIDDAAPSITAHLK